MVPFDVYAVIWNTNQQFHFINYILIIYYKDVILMTLHFQLANYKQVLPWVGWPALMLTIPKQNEMNKEIIQSSKPTKSK